MCADGFRTTVPSDLARKRRDDVVIHEIDGEAILYDPRTGNSHRLNVTALDIFQCCDGAATAARVAESLSHRYDESIDVLREQVRVAIDALDARGLLEPTARRSGGAIRE